MRVIDIDPADTFFSVRHRLLQNGRERTVLVLPGGDNPVGPIDLVLLRRLADRERLEIGLVTADRSLSREARAAGLPAFSNVTLAEYYRPGWWRAGRRKAQIGFASADERRRMHQKAYPAAAPASPSTRRRTWLALPVALLAALALMAALYAVPQAEVVLRVPPVPAQAIIDLTADPALATAAGATLSGSPIDHALEWEAAGPSTGDPAADRERIRAQALQGLRAAAPGMLSARLDPGLWLVPASVRVEVADESFTPGAETSLLRLRATLSGLTVARADVNRAAYGALAAALPRDYAPDVAEMHVTIEPAAGVGSSQFQVTARTTAAPVVDAEGLAQAVRGLPVDEATAYLSSALNLSQPPVIEAHPGWLWALVGRLPLNAERIHVEVRP